MATKKRDGRQSQMGILKNQIRGSKRPWKSLSQVRGIIPASELKPFISWLPSVRRDGRGVLDGLLPRNLADLSRYGALAPVSLDREIAWVTAILDQNAPQLTRFVEFRLAYETAIATSNTSASKSLLAELEAQFGHSLWLFEAKIALLQEIDGLETQKAFARSIRIERGRNDIVAFLTHHFSRRNEPTTTPGRFTRQIQDMISGWDQHPHLREYVRFRLTNEKIITPDRAAAILSIETAAALIDQYEAFIFVSLRLAALAYVDASRTLTNSLMSLYEKIPDHRITRALFLLTTDDKWLHRLPIGPVDALDAASVGDYHTVKEASTSELDNFALWTTQVETRVRLGAPPMNDGSVLARTMFYSYHAIGRTDERNDAIVNLSKDALNYRQFGFSSAIDDLLWRQLSDDPAQNGAIATFAFLQRRYLLPTDLACLPTSGQQNALARWFQIARPASASLAEQLVRAGIEIASDDTDVLATVVPDLILDARIVHALSRDDFDDVLALSEQLALSNDTLFRSAAARYTAHSLLKLGRIRELCSFIATRGVHDPSLIDILCVGPCGDALDKATRRELAWEIAVPIVLDFYCKELDDRLSGIRAYAYEDFLLAHDLERPSQLDDHISKFEHSLLVYYLRHVCVHSVMQMSSAFGGTRDLEDERKSVLSMLVKLDPMNANEYETELRDITRTQMIQRGVRQVEQSKIYIDEPAIRRLFEKKNKENFQRYQALIKAGIGTGTTALETALDEALSGKPLTQELLEVPKDEASDILVQILSWLFAECTRNPEHGLDCYLSMRIRHGTLSGQMRTPLEVEKIITQRSADTKNYEANEYWLKRLSHIDELTQAAIDIRLTRFSADYDALINCVANELIQIKGSGKPRGLFDVGVKSVLFNLWVTSLQSDMSFDAFTDSCMELFWESVDRSLDEVRRLIDEDLKTRVTSMFAELEEDVVRISGDQSTTDLDRSIRTALTGAQQALDRVKDWFKLPKPATEPYFPIGDLIDVGLQCVRTIHPEFEPSVERSVAPLPPFAGALVLFSDIFFIIFDNIRRHSGVGRRPQVLIDVSDTGDRLRIVTRSQISPAACNEAARDKIDRIKAAIERDDYLKAMSSEGGTGLIKLRRLIAKSRAEVMPFDFGFEDTKFFVVQFDLPKKVIAR